jgi:hypothetical protein
MRFPIDARREIVIAGRLVMVGCGLIALCTSLIVLRRALIGVGERLVSLTGGLLTFRQRPLAFDEKRCPTG